MFGLVCLEYLTLGYMSSGCPEYSTRDKCYILALGLGLALVSSSPLGYVLL